MGMYNMLFGVNPASRVILATLGLTTSDVGRFRDCFVQMNGDDVEVAVYTRNGGGNREHYPGASHAQGDATCWASDDGWKVVEGCAQEHPPLPEAGPGCDCTGCIIEYRLPAHPLYLRDEDDDFDCTYATVYFKAPDEFRDTLGAIASDVPFDPDERWLAMLAAIRG